MLVFEAGSTVAMFFSGGELGKITLTGDVVEEPRSRDGDSKTLSGECGPRLTHFGTAC